MSADSVFCQPSVPSLPAPFAVDPARANYTGLAYGLYIPGTSSARVIPGALSTLFTASELDFSIDFAGTYTGAITTPKTNFSRSYSGVLKKGVARYIYHSADGLFDVDTETGTAITSIYREWRPDDTSSMWKTGGSGEPLSWEEVEDEDAVPYGGPPGSYFHYVFQIFMHPVPVETDPFNNPPTLNFYPQLTVWHPRCTVHWEVGYAASSMAVPDLLVGAGGNDGFPATGTGISGLDYMGIGWELQETDMDTVSGSITLGAWHTDY